MSSRYSRPPGFVPMVAQLSEAHAEIAVLRNSLNDCVALILGHVSGPAQRDGIIKEAIAALRDQYSGPAALSSHEVR